MDMTGSYPGESSQRRDPRGTDASRSTDASTSPGHETASGDTSEHADSAATSRSAGFHSDDFDTSTGVIDADASEVETDHSSQSSLRHWWSTHARRSSSVELITDQEKRTPWQNHEHRKIIYMWMQGMRIPFLVGSAITYLVWHNILLSWVIFLISVPLPWISVVIANGAGEPRDKREQNVYRPEQVRAEHAHSTYAALHAPSPTTDASADVPALEQADPRRDTAPGDGEPTQ